MAARGARNRSWLFVPVLFMAVLLTATAPHASAEVTGETTRLAGAERIATAVAVSQAQWGQGEASRVVVARSDEPADAVAATPAAANRGPLLLSPADSLPDATASEIERVLAPDGVVVLVGGTAALSPSVGSQVERLGVRTQRIAGPNRFATAVRLADYQADPEAPAGAQSAWLADGTGFADPLLAGTRAAPGDGAVLLTAGDRMPAETMAALQGLPASSISVVGGAASRAASDAGVVVEQELVGANRYATSRLSAELPGSPAQSRSAALASGQEFADALSGGADAATRGVPLLLTPRDELPDSVQDWFDSRSLDSVVVYGGTDAVSDTAVEQAQGS